VFEPFCFITCQAVKHPQLSTVTGIRNSGLPPPLSSTQIHFNTRRHKLMESLLKLRCARIGDSVNAFPLMPGSPAGPHRFAHRSACQGSYIKSRDKKHTWRTIHEAKSLEINYVRVQGTQRLGSETKPQSYALRKELIPLCSLPRTLINFEG